MVTPHKILLVSASAEFRREQTRPVVESGCESVAVEGLAQALRWMDSQRPLLTIVDGPIAEQSTAAGRAQLKAHPTGGDAPVVLAAAADCPAELLERCWSSGVDDYLSLPLQPAHIRTRVEAVLNAARPVPAPIGMLAGKIVAIVGDEAPAAALTAKLLSLNGFRVRNLREGQVPEPMALGKVEAIVACVSSWRSGVAALRSAQRCLSPAPELLLLYGPAPVPPVASEADICRIDPAQPPEAVVRRVNAQFNRLAENLRAEPRLPFFCPVQFREAGGSRPGQWTSCFSYDISSGGIFLRTLVPARPGSALELGLGLEGSGERLSLNGVVAWANPYSGRSIFSYPVGMGVRFLGIVPLRLAALIDACRSREEAAATGDRS